MSLPALSGVRAARLLRTGLAVDDDSLLLIEDTEDSFSAGDPEIRPLEPRVAMVRFTGFLEVEFSPTLVVLLLPLPRLVRDLLDTDVDDVEAAGESWGAFSREVMDLSEGVDLVAERIAVLLVVVAGLLSISNELRVVRVVRGVGLEAVVFFESDFPAAFFSVDRFAVSVLDVTMAGESSLFRFLLLVLNAGESVFSVSAFFVAVVACFLFVDLAFSADTFALLAASFLAESVFS